MAKSKVSVRSALTVAQITMLLLIFQPTAFANASRPNSGGNLAAEPVGVEDVTITKETLDIDLRALAENGLARVEAIYHLANNGTEKKLRLVFASGSATSADFQVWFGDQLIPSRRVPDLKLPTSWQVPKKTPGLHGRDELEYQPLDVTPVAFNLIIPPGLHNLTVRYSAEATTHRYGYPTVYRQFAYVLAPARAWSGFGELDVTIHLPKNWYASCSPELTRDGDTLKGSFSGLPADAITLTVQAPKGGAYQPVSYISVGIFALAGLMGAVICWRGGRSKGRYLALSSKLRPYWRDDRAWPTSIGLGFGWGLSVLATGLLAVYGPDWVLPSGQVSHYGYAQGLATLGVVFLSILVVIVGFLIAQVTAAVVLRRTAPATTNNRR